MNINHNVDQFHIHKVDEDNAGTLLIASSVGLTDQGKYEGTYIEREAFGHFDDSNEIGIPRTRSEAA